MSSGEERGLLSRTAAGNRAYTLRDEYYLTVRLRARVFFEQIVNEAQPS